MASPNSNVKIGSSKKHKKIFSNLREWYADVRIVIKLNFLVQMKSHQKSVIIEFDAWPPTPSSPKFLNNSWRHFFYGPLKFTLRFIFVTRVQSNLNGFTMFNIHFFQYLKLNFMQVSSVFFVFFELLRFQIVAEEATFFSFTLPIPFAILEFRCP